MTCKADSDNSNAFCFCLYLTILRSVGLENIINNSILSQSLVALTVEVKSLVEIT